MSAAPSMGKGVRKERPTAIPPSRAEQKLRAFHEENAIGKAYDARLARRLLPYVLPHARFVVISLTTLVLMAGVSLFRPIVMGDVVKQASEAHGDLLLRDGA